MNDLIKYVENNTDIIYTLSNNNLVSIPKQLGDNIKVFMNFKDKDNHDYNKIIKEMQEISTNLNQNNGNCLLITLFLNDNLIEQGNAFNFVNELNKLKYIVNNIYNKLRLERNLEKDAFIKKVNLLSLESKYNDFINWICLQEPAKFQVFNHQQLQIFNKEKSDIFINNNVPNIFNEPNRQSSMMAMQSNVKPINENLTIGTPNYSPNASGQYMGMSGQEFYNQKRLVRTPDNKHGSAAFIKWYTTLFILVMSLVIGITISIFLVK